MSGINLTSQLKDYLSKSSSSNSIGSTGLNGSGVNGQSGQSGYSGVKKGGWFSSTRSSNDMNGEAGLTLDNASMSTNGWFSEAQKDPFLPSLSKQQRVIGFVGCLLMGTFCFSLASLYVPFLVLKARKFAMLYTMGSLFIIASFSLLWGPWNHVKHLLSADRLPFTTAYFGTMFATIYFSLWTQSMPLTIVFAICQVLALVWYVVSYIPGGQTGLKFFSRVFYAAASKTVQKTLPV